MKKLITLLLAGSTLAAAAGVPARYGIIPAPRSLEPAEGVFTLKSTTALTVEARDTLFREVAEDFARQVRRTTGYAILSGAERPRSRIILRQVDGLGEEAYRLTVAPSEVCVEASAAHGAFYGIQTLCQLLPAEIYGDTRARGVRWQAPCCRIEDEPRFPYRGMMLDVGRYFLPAESVKKFIDLMAMHKQNMFHWHLTEDQGWRIEIRKYPRLTEIGSWRRETAGYAGREKSDGTPHGGFYTQDDVREIVEYARRRYVTVIPEIELPGHSTAAIAAYPELACFPDRNYEVATTWGIKKDVYCPKGFTFRFLEDVFTELFDLFPSPYYHIGGDECPKERWKECPHCQELMEILGLDDEEQLQTFFVKRIDGFLRQHGKTVIGWDEILDGGAVESTVALSYRGHAPAARALSRNMYTILAPNRWCYLDYNQQDIDEGGQGLFLPLRKVYDYFPKIDSMPDRSRKYILGLQGCVWGEYIPTSERMEYMAFPRALALAEAGWCDLPDKDWESFRVRMEKGLRRLDAKRVGYCPAYYNVLFLFDREAPYPREVELELDYPGAEIRYTTDGSAPSPSSPRYSAPLAVEKGTRIRACGFTPDGKATGSAVEKTF